MSAGESSTQLSWRSAVRTPNQANTTASAGQQQGHALREIERGEGAGGDGEAEGDAQIVRHEAGGRIVIVLHRPLREPRPLRIGSDRRGRALPIPLAAAPDLSSRQFSDSGGQADPPGAVRLGLR